MTLRRVSFSSKVIKNNLIKKKFFFDIFLQRFFKRQFTGRFKKKVTTRITNTPVLDFRLCFNFYFFLNYMTKHQKKKNNKKIQ